MTKYTVFIDLKPTTRRGCLMNFVKTLFKIIVRPSKRKREQGKMQGKIIPSPRKDEVVVEYHNPQTGETCRTAFIILAD